MKMQSNKLMRTVGRHSKELARYLSKNSPTILTGVAIAGAFTAVGLAIKATKPALKHIEEEKIAHRDRIIIIDGDKREEEGDHELTQEEIDSIQLKPIEVVKACWKDYIPTAVALGGTAACIIGAHSISAKRTAAMAALYTMSEQTLKDYKEQTEKIVGKGKATQIKDAVAEESLSRNAPGPDVAGAPAAPGDVWCYDCMSGRYFQSNMQKIRAAIAELNARMAYGERISKNDFYYEIGCDGVQFGDDTGWSTENQIDVEFTSSLMSNGTPVLAIQHKNAPSAWYYD